jgi:hypothetical protein
MINSVAGIASNAPNGPSTQAQNTSDTNVRAVDKPTASPTNRGWINDCTTKLITT